MNLSPLGWIFLAGGVSSDVGVSNNVVSDWKHKVVFLVKWRVGVGDGLYKTSEMDPQMFPTDHG